MFSKLDGIFAGLPTRHVEKANARLEIRRDETDKDGRKKNHHEEGSYTPAEWEDTAYVSIASLRAFLESVVAAEDPQIQVAPPVHGASNTLNQRAASAYQSVGRAGHDQNVYPPPASTDIETNFTETDIARVKIFIADLADLSRAGIEELPMQKSASFLDSIGAAIAAAKAA